MSESTETGSALTQIQPKLNPFTHDELKFSSIPIEIYVEEALELADNLEADAPEFRRLRLKAAKEAAIIRLAAHGLAEAEINWDNARRLSEEKTKLWLELKPKGYATRAEWTDFLEFVLEELGDKDGLVQLKEIREGTGDADMTFDIGKIAKVLRERLELLDEYEISIEEVQELEQFYSILLDLNAGSSSERKQSKEEKDIRDRAYTYLHGLVNRARKAGRIVFRGRSSDLKRYRSDYVHNKY